LGRDKRYIKEKAGKKFKGILVFIVLFCCMGIPIVILTFSNNIKAKFFAYTMVDSFLVVILFLFGFFSVNIRVMGIVFGAICLVGSIYLSIPTINYYKDIPKIINSNYSFYKGKLTKVKDHRFERSISTTLTINNQKFEIHGALSPIFKIIGKEYYVTFLPNSKFVIDLK